MAVFGSESSGGGENLLDVAREARQRRKSTRSPYDETEFLARSGLPPFSANLRAPELEVQMESEKSSAFDRMFRSRIGPTAINIVGNETRTLNILESFGADLLLGMVELDYRGPNALATPLGRAVVVPSDHSAPAALMILDPDRTIGETRIVTDETRLNFDRLTFFAESVPRPLSVTDDVGRLQEFLFSTGRDGLAETLTITRPDLILSRLPRMEPLCAPWPFIEVRSGLQISTAGILCRDSAGNLGVTACHHGTGPVGTNVTVGLQASSVTIADLVQDTVFIPLSAGYNVPPVRGVNGVLSNRTPGQYDHVEFHGATSGATTTHVTSYDAGLLRKRPTVQLRVQTGADTNTGDSGSALVNQDDKIIGFAFERSAFGDIPQMTDWIWAANALDALGLTPI